MTMTEMQIQATEVQELLATARAWRQEDPDPATVAELAAIIDLVDQGDSKALAELVDMFDGTLEFGTAGLRGKLGAGSNRMNRVVVTRAARGLATYLLEKAEKAELAGENPAELSIVIGFDARYNSDIFARDTAEIMAGAGIKAYLHNRHLPTPLVAYAIRPLGCAAGVMVTASHNPPQDNGYKVYLGDGSQIVPPADSEISAHIAAVGDIRQLPRSGDYTVLNDDIIEAYIERAISLVKLPDRDVRAVYTPMHGVGGEVFDEVAKRAGFPPPIDVKEQWEPDPDFPTVAFPNPEEPGAMDLAIKTAEREDVDVIIAHDPDADRCSAGYFSQVDGWKMLTGDQVGALLGWWILKRAELLGEEVSGAFAASIVSGTLLREIATRAGLDYATTLTGFKWISKVPSLRFGYEEALGYCVDPEAVADKDGTSASLLVMELAGWLKANGRTIQDALDDIAREYGVYATRQLAVRVTDISLIADAMDRMRLAPPAAIGEHPVTEVLDLEAGVDGAGPTNGLRFVFAGGHITVRPSGTEPKLKCYIEVVVPVTDSVGDAQQEAERKIASLRSSMVSVLGL